MGKLRRWMDSGLTNRRQRVVLNDKSQRHAVGSPQGSGAGALLFGIFCYKIDEVVKKIDITKRFAENTKMDQRMMTDTKASYKMPWINGSKLGLCSSMCP
jgi:hypothetical protein